jgi:hypothetical protein
MEMIKVFLSPSFTYEFYDEPVSGMRFEKGRRIQVYSINTHGLDLTGIQNALRKNILLPFDVETREFASTVNFATLKPVQEEVQVKEEAVVEEVKEEVEIESEKKSRKKNKKDAE